MDSIQWKSYDLPINICNIASRFTSSGKWWKEQKCVACGEQCFYLDYKHLLV